jgi:hypothetical protein
MSLNDRIVRAFTWLAAFALATGVYQSITLLFGRLPATDPVAIGVVTIERYSKLKDYLGAALFFLIVPPLTIYLAGVFRRAVAQRDVASSLLLLGPYTLAPLFYLTTGKVGWILLLPVALSFAAVSLYDVARTRLWIRELCRRELGPYHALIFVEALSWVVFRYLVTGRRIAHIPTLFLEVVFVAAFLALFWAVAFVIARVASLLFGRDAEDVFKRVASGALPLVALPFVAVIVVPTPYPRLITIAALVLSAILAMRSPLRPRAAWNLTAYALIPALIYAVSYASTSHLSQWIDLFHRGEAVGPASDYLRGKVPYRDVFVLHGLLEDGLLDAWLMQLFGRSIDVAILRPVVLASLLAPLLWYLGIAIFDSIPLALLCVAMGSWTTAENNRTFLQVAAVALFWIALRRRSKLAAVLSGVLGGIALFHSYEIGLYTIAGALAASIAIGVLTTRIAWSGLRPLHAALFFLVGVAIGAAPFVLFLAAKGALDDFFFTSFVVIPRIIDAIWSLPFPDLVSTFRRNLTLHTLADFVLWEKFHLILSPLVIVVSAIYCIGRWLQRKSDMLDHALAVLAVFALIAQRTAFGRAEFRHQYFAAFLIGPMLVILAIFCTRALRGVWRESAVVAALLVAILIPMIAVLFWIPDLVNARINDVVRYQARVLRVDRDEAAEAVSWRIKDVTGEIRKLVPKGQPIFDFSNQPAFYFFADRPNPTRFYQVPILSPRAFQRETIAALERAKPRVVIRKSPDGFDQFDGVTNDLRAQAVSAYLDDCYAFHRSLRGVELWTRKPGAKPLAVAQYLERIRLPEKNELVFGAVHRLVFPAVGSTVGAGGSYWQSDLTMHNPFTAAMPVTMRYVAGDTRKDRRLTLAPRQTVRWPDVAKTFFNAPNTVGTLWVEHRENRAPVAVIKTWDAAHGGAASVEKPLSRRDGATANTDASELTIVGIPSGSGRRVNVGVVNIGIIPATFRITARTRTGEIVGVAIESGIPEDEVWLTPNIEQALGVQLDDSITLRLTAIAGTGVGFATVVEASGDTEFIAAIPSTP